MIRTRSYSLGAFCEESHEKPCEESSFPPHTLLSCCGQVGELTAWRELRHVLTPELESAFHVPTRTIVIAVGLCLFASLVCTHSMTPAFEHLAC